MTEIVDWKNGEDPQHRVQLPISKPDHEMLMTRDPGAIEAVVGTLGPERRALHFDWPTGGEKRCYWGVGLQVPPHD